MNTQTLDDVKNFQTPPALGEHMAYMLRQDIGTGSFLSFKIFQVD